MVSEVGTACLLFIYLCIYMAKHDMFIRISSETANNTACLEN